MSHYNLRISIPKSLDQILTAPLLFLRKIWYGYSFRRIPLVNSNLHAIVDSQDFYELCKFTWWVFEAHGSSFHAIRFTADNRRKFYVFMHRQIMQTELNSKLNTQSSELTNLQSKLVVDHINNNGLDNRRINLRLITQHQNNMNRRKTMGSSKFKGVSFRRKKWRATITYNYKNLHLGTFNNEIDAAKAYDAAALKYFGEYANLNFPPKKKEKGLKNLFSRIAEGLNRNFKF